MNIPPEKIQNKKPLLTIGLTTALMLLNLNANAGNQQNQIDEVSSLTQDKTNLILKEIEFNYINDGTFPNGENVDMGNAFGFELNSLASYEGNNYKANLGYYSYINDGESRAESQKRADEFDFNIQKQIFNSTTYIGGGFQTFGNYGGKKIQNGIHSIVGDTQIEKAEYGESFITPTINASYGKTFEIGKGFDLDIKAEGTLPLIIDNGIINADLNGVINKEILGAEIGAGLGAGYTKYPDQEVFNGEPLSHENGLSSYGILKTSTEIYGVKASIEFIVPIAGGMAETTNNSTLILGIKKRF